MNLPLSGAQIIDLMLLVVDAQKGIQTQTAECLIIGELLQKKLIVVINKIDAFPADQREAKLEKLRLRLCKTLEATSFGRQVPMYAVSALEGINIQELRAGLSEAYFQPERNVTAPLLMYVDHCFGIKGQGTVCTGTLLQGKVQVNDMIELPALKEQRKVKSMQMFRQNVTSASMGDRIGLCVTQFNAKLLERGVISQPGYLKRIYAVCLQLKPIRYYKQTIKSKSKLHVSLGHDTVMANVTLFRDTDNPSQDFQLDKEYEYVEELQPEEASNNDVIFALLEFETPVLAPPNSTLIASKLDMDVHSTSCRLAFWGRIAWQTQSVNYTHEVLPQLRIFKRKQKVGSIQRVVNANEVIVQNLFKKKAKRELYVGKTVELSTGERGRIDRKFGQTSKVAISFQESLSPDTISSVKDVQVLLKCKKYVFNKQAGLFQ